MGTTVQRIDILQVGYTGTLTVLDCAGCGLVFAMTWDFEARRREDHKTYYCPAGHENYFPHKTEAEQLRERLRIYRDQAATERRRAAAARGQRTRVLNLITKGICPVPGCRRNFTNVREHMSSQHPDYHVHEVAQ